MDGSTNKSGSYVFASELGWMALAWRGDELARFSFGHPSAAAAVGAIDADGWTATREGDLPAWVADLAGRLQAYAAGDEVRFDDVPLDQSHLGPFSQRVVRLCRKISRGKTRSYAELAAAAGSPGAARAVGNVMASNRFPIIVPCHRVVGSGGSLGGFSAPEGLSMKSRMLALEGHTSPQRKQGKRSLHRNRRRITLAGALG